jgi:hypothetical protein
MKRFADWLGMQEEFGPYIGNCTDTDDYQVVGACSDQNSEKKNSGYRRGIVDHKKVRKHSDKVRN